MFFKNKYHEIRWDERPNKKPIGKITLKIDSIKPWKKSFFGTRNSDAGFDFVFNAMEVLGKAIFHEGVQIEKEILFLVPEEEIQNLTEGDSLMMWLPSINYCNKFEKL